MKYRHDFMVGDHYWDGHGKTQVISFYSNCPQDVIRDAYARTSIKLGIDIFREGLIEHTRDDVIRLFLDYEDSMICSEALDRLEEGGVSLDWDNRSNEFQIDDYDERELGCSSEDVVGLYISMAKRELSGFRYTMIPDQFINQESAGYGVFYR